MSFVLTNYIKESHMQPFKIILFKGKHIHIPY